MGDSARGRWSCSTEGTEELKLSPGVQGTKEGALLQDQYWTSNTINMLVKLVVLTQSSVPPSCLKQGLVLKTWPGELQIRINWPQLGGDGRAKAGEQAGPGMPQLNMIAPPSKFLSLSSLGTFVLIFLKTYLQKKQITFIVFFPIWNQLTQSYRKSAKNSCVPFTQFLRTLTPCITTGQLQ